MISCGPDELPAPFPATIIGIVLLLCAKAESQVAIVFTPFTAQVKLDGPAETADFLQEVTTKLSRMPRQITAGINFFFMMQGLKNTISVTVN